MLLGMKTLTVISLFLVFCSAEHKISKRQTYICGVYPYQYYSNGPCTQPGVRQPQPGSRCQNGGTYIGWTCQQASQCQFQTPSGILNGHCSGGLCCTARQNSPSTNSQCPSNMIRKNRSCSTDSQCSLLSNSQRLRGKCKNRRCCVPKAASQSQKHCNSNERRTNRRCSRSNPCQRNSYWTIVTCRQNYCCERNTIQGSGGQSCTNPMTQHQCNYDSDCSHLAQTANQKATCDQRRRHCCLSVCPQGSVPQQAKCSTGATTCQFQRNGYVEQGVCYGNGVCCSQQQQISNPCAAYGRTWTNQQCALNGACYAGSSCINGYCCA